MNSTWIGMDVSKDSFFAAIDINALNLKHQLNELPCEKFERNHKGVRKFLSWTQEVLHTDNISIIMESTGAYSIELMYWLKELNSNITVAIQNGRQISDFTRSLNLPHKTDKNDACAIARFGTERTPKASNIRPSHWRKLRELQRERTAIIEARVTLENRADSLFHKESCFFTRISGCHKLKLSLI